MIGPGMENVILIVEYWAAAQVSSDECRLLQLYVQVGGGGGTRERRTRDAVVFLTKNTY